jgi:hypothetical protein
MINRHYGHLARDGREHAIRLLDGYADIKATDVQALASDGRRSRPGSSVTTTETGTGQEETESPLTDSNRRPPPYHVRVGGCAALRLAAKGADLGGFGRLRLRPVDPAG